MSELSDDIKHLLYNINRFIQFGSGITLRSYQRIVAETILDSVINCRGDTFVVMFPRQSGKNELQAQIESYLLVLFSEIDVEMVKVSPTWKPQTQNAMRRLERVLKRNSLARYIWKKEAGYIYCVGNARMIFLSGAPASSVVGATATHLLECDEAQDVGASKWDKEFSPMAASRNATRVFWGTAWTSKTLLARELRAARQAENRDGRRRAFILTADDIRVEVPEYGVYVDGQVARLGRNHPMVRTQYFSEEIDSEGGMFPPSRQGLMRGTHPPLTSPSLSAEIKTNLKNNRLYCFLLDVAGEDEFSPVDGGFSEYKSVGEGLSYPSRDSTALTIVEVDLATLTNDLVQAPTYRVVNRLQWVGVKYTKLYRQIIDLTETWSARYLVVDSTGVGAGLTSFLDRALPGRVIPFIFTAKSKSDLGWSFLSVIETGRYKEYLISPDDISLHGKLDLTLYKLQQIFWQQVENCQSQILEGPGKVMRWGVPDGFRDPLTGELVHDDLIISASLVSVLDTLSWGLAHSNLAASPDLFEGMSESY